MRLASIKVQDFKRFTNLTIRNLPESAKLVVLVGPNGSGKSSLFEAFNFWVGPSRGVQYDAQYHHKITVPTTDNWAVVHNKISLTFHDVQFSPQQNHALAKKAFYFRSAYRHEPDFNMVSLQRSDEILADSKRPPFLISTDARVADDYQRLVFDSLEALYAEANQQATVGEITSRLIGPIREAMRRVFGDLILEGVGTPTFQGTFLFDKGASKRFRYKNLSGGEKAAFDLLLDFIVKRQEFNNTIFCIDEPEAHINTRLQGALLEELYRQLPTGCQLWIETHAVGVTHAAVQLSLREPGSVVFLDFSDQDFDAPATIEPASVDPAFWKRTFDVALGDLANLVAPEEIVFCEGRPEVVGTGSRSTFDATIYRAIFRNEHSRTDFIPLGGVSEVERNAMYLTGVFGRLFPSMRMWTIIDRDDRSPTEVATLLTQNTRVLTRRDLENFLWDDEIVTRLCAHHNQPDASATLIARKRTLIAAAVKNGSPPDDIKKIKGLLYNEVKSLLKLIACGNDADEFAKVTLAPLVTSDTTTYRDLERAVFPAKP